jgi:rare lipoprotein A
VNDRGPFIPGRDLDLSYEAARKIGLANDGVGKVKVKVIKWGDNETKK